MHPLKPPTVTVSNTPNRRARTVRGPPPRGSGVEVVRDKNGIIVVGNSSRLSRSCGPVGRSLVVFLVEELRTVHVGGFPAVRPPGSRRTFLRPRFRRRPVSSGGRRRGSAVAPPPRRSHRTDRNDRCLSTMEHFSFLRGLFHPLEDLRVGPVAVQRAGAPGISLLPPSLQVLVDVLELAIERAFADAERLGGLPPVAVEPLEGPADELLLRLLQRRQLLVLVGRIAGLRCP